MHSSSYTPDLQDMKFVLFEHLGLGRILGRGPYGHVTEEDVQMILDLGSDFVSNVIAPTNAAGDEIGCKWEEGRVTVPRIFEPLWAAMREQGWFGVIAPVQYGGQGLPKVIGTATDEMLIAANPAFHTYVSLCRGATNLLVNHAAREINDLFVPKISSGEWQGTMCLTEAGAGSDVGASLTRATPAGDGTYRISGTKVFITAGEHQMTPNHIHLVLARLPDAPAGVRGLSLFLVPKIRVNPAGELTIPNDVYCSKIEKKMGIHGSATTVLNFGENNGCIGYLIGKEHEGIRCMFDMMNEERIGVGLQGAALASAMYTNALKYAQERIQGSDIAEGKSITEAKIPIVRHPDVRRMLMTVRAIAEGARALLYYTSLQLDLAITAENGTTRAAHEGRAALLTPVCKAWGSDAGFDACSQALQVYGGSGFVCDYPAEQHLRDARISSIFEGTNGIQAIDLLFRKTLGSGGKLVQSLRDEISGWMQTHASHPLLAREVRALGLAVEEWETTTALLDKKAREDLPLAALSACPYLSITGNLVAGWLLLDQAVVAASRPERAEFYAAKIETARFFTHQILSQNRWRAAQIASNDRSAIEIALEQP